MFRYTLIAFSFVLVSGLLAAELSEKFAKRLESADAAYQSAVTKADNVRFYALQKATQDRVKILKSALTDATKAGDFDAATEIKRRVAAAETTGGVRAKPKNVVKFGGHEYALIEDKVTWHVAKRLCEEMGGHLATGETATEATGILTMCAMAKCNAWFGASDEDKEGDWHWITGPKVQFEFRRDNSGEAEHYLAYYGGSWEDLGDARFSFVCEWDN